MSVASSAATGETFLSAVMQGSHPLSSNLSQFLECQMSIWYPVLFLWIPQSQSFCFCF